MAITNFIPTVWSEQLYHALSAKHIAVQHCNRMYEGEIREKGSAVRICGIDPISISDYTKNMDMGAPTTLTDNERTLYINQAKYFNFQIDDIDRVQGNPQLMELAMANAANALADAADRYIYEMYDYADNVLEADIPTVDNILNHIIDAKTRLLMNGCTSDEIIVEVSPEIASFILKAKIKYSSDNTESLEHGCIGSIGGCKVYVSKNIYTMDCSTTIDHMCYVRSTRAFAFAEQLSEVDAYRPERRFADAVKGLYLFGAKVVYPQEWIVVRFCIPHN